MDGGKREGGERGRRIDDEMIDQGKGRPPRYIPQRCSLATIAKMRL